MNSFKITKINTATVHELFVPTHVKKRQINCLCKILSTFYFHLLQMLQGTVKFKRIIKGNTFCMSFVIIFVLPLRIFRVNFLHIQHFLYLWTYKQVQQSSAAILIILGNSLQFNNSVWSPYWCHWTVHSELTLTIFIYTLFYPCASNLLFNLNITGRKTLLLFEVV